jgi:biotin-dependent carboxylase-like uncharacterized protein
MALQVIDPGLWTTIQDGGRLGHRARGVPDGGAFDRDALALANALAANELDAAALDFTLRGGSYRATIDLGLALAGARFPARIEARDRPDRVLAPPSSFTLHAGERLVLGAMATGARAYLAVSGGGWLVPEVLGSRSSETPLAPGDDLPARTGRLPVRRILHADTGSSDVMLRIVAGPDADRVVEGTSVGGKGPCFRVSPRSDRMGVRLEGPRLDLSDTRSDRLSAPVWPGAVQVAGGQLILLGVACGTLGGYPHVAQVISADLPRLAQLRPGSMVGFETVSMEQARQAGLAAARARRSHWLRVACAAGWSSRISGDRV